MSWILLNSGGRFDYLQPEKSIFTIHDIAQGLSRINRFLGQTLTPLSVAQHSVNVSYLVPADQALAALLHDAAEAFVGDVATPLKQVLGAAWKSLENNVEAEVFKRLGVNPHTPEIKLADLIMLATERRCLFPADDGTPWGCLEGIEPLDMSSGVPYAWKYYRIGGRVDPEEVRRTFLARYFELGGL